jgi:hypothetical protein
MRRTVVFLLLGAALMVAAHAAEQSPLPLQSRTESLELPGLTAGCHVCEWRPKLNQMPAPEQCGTDEAGAGRIGTFECGFTEDCQRECRFLGCGTP